MIELRVPKDEVERWNRLMAGNKKNIRLGDLERVPDIVFAEEVCFDDGVMAELTVNKTRPDVAYCRMKWWGVHGYAIETADMRFKLDGAWKCENHPDYSVNVVVE